MENYREYFIIGENIEKFNLTYQEVIYYIKSTINFKDPNKFIQRYRNESDFTYEYLKKQYNFVSKGYNFTDEQLLKIFKKRKYISILIIVLILLIELIFYKTIKNHKKIKLSKKYNVLIQKGDINADAMELKENDRFGDSRNY